MTHRYGHVCLVLLVGLMMSRSAVGHHSVAAQFDASKQVTVTGSISKVEWVNPHIYVYIDVADDKSETVTWAMETVTPAMARRAGLTQESLWGNGEPVTIEAIPARDENLKLGYVRKFTFSDGRFIQMSVSQ